jgi:hypothetical protein
LAAKIAQEKSAVAGNNPFDVPFDQLSLESAADGLSPTAGAAPSGRAVFQVDTRGGRDRRVRDERRVEFRLTADRRSGKDRRPRKSWEPGRNL